MFGILSQYLIKAGAARAPKVRGAKSPILPHFSKYSSFIAFLCDNFLGFSKSGGAAAPLDPVDTRPLIGIVCIYEYEYDTFALIVSIPCGLRKYAFYCPTRKIHKDRRSHFNVPAGLFLPALLSYWVEHIRHSTLLRGEPVVLRKRSRIPAVLLRLRTRSY